MKHPGPKSAADMENWRKLAARELRSQGPDDLLWETPEGITIKPLYTAEDLEKLEHVDTPV